jgi:hypothetical protein
MPVLWFEQHVVATRTVSNLVKIILAAPTTGQIFGVAVAIIGIALLLAAFLKDSLNSEVVADQMKTESQKPTNLPESLPLMKHKVIEQ